MESDFLLKVKQVHVEQKFYPHSTIKLLTEKSDQKDSGHPFADSLYLNICSLKEMDPYENILKT